MVGSYLIETIVAIKGVHGGGTPKGVTTSPWEAVDGAHYVFRMRDTLMQKRRDMRKWVRGVQRHDLMKQLESTLSHLVDRF